MNIESVNQMRWTKGYIVPFWTKDDYANLSYVKQGITDEEVNTWVNDGYPRNLSFTGMMYDNKNTLPSFTEKLKEYFYHQYKDLTFTFYKMESMDIMPNHVDHFRTYCRLFDVDRTEVVRILLMLEDWKPGHYLEINGKGITNWIAGDYFIWESEVPHAASNIGKSIDTRYTLQITATKRPYQPDVGFYIFNFGPKYDSTIIKDEIVIKRINHAIKNNDSNPYYIKLSNGRLLDLEKILHTQEEIETLNNTGIDVYLYEPLSLFNKDEGNFYNSPYYHSEKFYSEFATIARPEQIRADELDSILIYKNNNNLNNIRVHLCDWNTEIWLPFYKNELELIYNDVFVKTIYDRLVINNTFEPLKFNKKFINLNYRYTFHRHLTAAYVNQTNSCHLSWYFKCDYDNVKYSIWHNLDLWKDQEPDIYNRLIKGIDNLNEGSPFNLDFTINEPTVIEHRFFKDVFPKNKNITSVSNLTIENFYKETFVDIITETRFAQPTANYSEKVYQAMFYKRPFIVVGAPYTLRLLHDQGFDTFNQFWDESYDYTECHSLRLQTIFKLIDKINAMSLTECEEMYQKMQFVIEHNFKVVKSKIFPILE